MMQALSMGVASSATSRPPEIRRGFDSYVQEAVSHLKRYDNDVQGLVQAWAAPKRK